MSALDDRRMIIHALCGPVGGVDDSAGDLLGLALELAVAEAEAITDMLDIDQQGVGYALAGKLKALSRFVTFHVDATLVPVEGPVLKGVAKVVPNKRGNQARRLGS